MSHPERASAARAEGQELLPLPLLILHFIATGIVRYQEQHARGREFDGDYPDPLQRGLDLLNALRYRQQLPLIKSVPHLLSWCRRPLGEWSLNLEALGRELVSEEVLLHGHLPSELCLELACSTDEVEADLMERAFMEQVFSRCQQQGPQTYVALRRWLIEHPVVTAAELVRQLNASPELAQLQDLLREAYVEAPYEALYKGAFYCCPTCGALLQPDHTGLRLLCSIERCYQMPLAVSALSAASGDGSQRRQPLRRLVPSEEVASLRRGLLWFVMWPGRAELRLERRLCEQGALVEMWPDYDRYDLRVVVPRGTLAVDVKDWANPYLLARRVKPKGFFCEPGSQPYYVFPQERKIHQPDYVRAFKSAYDALGGPSLEESGIKAEFEDDFVREVLKLCR